MKLTRLLVRATKQYKDGFDNIRLFKTFNILQVVNWLDNRAILFLTPINVDYTAVDFIKWKQNYLLCGGSWVRHLDGGMVAL